LPKALLPKALTATEKLDDMDLTIAGAMRQLNLPPTENITPRDRLPLSKERLALGVEPMVYQGTELGSLGNREISEKAASGIFAHNARYFSHLWQPSRLRETRGFAPLPRRRFALDKDGKDSLTQKHREGKWEDPFLAPSPLSSPSEGRGSQMLPASGPVGLLRTTPLDGLL
jgi:hypothetical protein